MCPITPLFTGVVPEPIVVQVVGAEPEPISSFQFFNFDGCTLPTTSVEDVMVLPFDRLVIDTATTPVLFSVGAIGIPRACARATASSGWKLGSFTNFFV